MVDSAREKPFDLLKEFSVFIELVSLADSAAYLRTLLLCSAWGFSGGLSDTQGALECRPVPLLPRTTALMQPNDRDVALTRQFSGAVMDFVFQLAGEALKANPAVPLHRYVLAAQRLLIEADRQGASGDLLKRAVLLVRFVRLVVTTLPQHPAWSLESNRALREGLRSDAKRVLADLEQLRIDLAAQWRDTADASSATTKNRAATVDPTAVPDGMTTRQPLNSDGGQNTEDVDLSMADHSGKHTVELPTRADTQPGPVAKPPAQYPRGSSVERYHDASWLESSEGRANTEERLRNLMTGTRFIRDMFCETWHTDPNARKRQMVLYLLKHADVPVQRATIAVADSVLSEYLLISGEDTSFSNKAASSVPQDHERAWQPTREAASAEQEQDGAPDELLLPNDSGNRHRIDGGLSQPAVHPMIDRTLCFLQRMDLVTDADESAQVTSADVGDFSAAWRSQWCIGFQTLIIGPKIGSGGYGEVFVGKLRGQLVAIKHLQPVDGVYSPELLRSFRDEMLLMSRLSHPNIVRFIGACIHPPNLCILSEYVHGGTLYRLLQKRRRKRLDPNTGEPTGEMLVTEHLPWCGILRIALGIARGMRYLHAQKPIVVHRDLKSPNCLVFSASSPVLDDIPIDRGGEVPSCSQTGSLPAYGGPIRANEDFAEADAKLIDFGLSRTQLKSYISTGIAGTPEWMAPEVIRQDKVSESADVFSFGVILWELVTGRKPWEHLTQTQVVYRVGYLEEVLQLPPEAHPSIRALNAAACQMNPTRRPKFADIVAELERLCRESGVSIEAGEELMRRRFDTVTSEGRQQNPSVGP